MAIVPAGVRSVPLVVLALTSLLAACAKSELELEPLESSPHEPVSAAGHGAGASAGGSQGGAATDGRGGQGGRAGTGARFGGGRSAGGRNGEGGRGGTTEPRAGAAGNDGGRGGNSAGAAGAPTAGRAGMGGFAGFTAAGAGGQGETKPLAQCDFALTPNLEGPPPLALDTYPDSAVSGDFDGDGKLDLATANVYGSVTVLLGRGDGSFAPPHDYVTHLESTTPVSGFVTAGDLDGNGTLDLVVSAQSSFLSILWGAGDGTFERSDTYAFYTNVTAVVLGDFDGDTLPDITVATEKRVDTEIQFLRNTGQGVFDGTVITHSTTDIWGLAAADVNEDGLLDLAALSDDEVVFYVGEGGGNFGRSYEYVNTVFPGPVRLGDFDGDGHIDFVAPYRCGMELFPTSAVHVRLGAGDGSFGPDSSYPVDNCLGNVLAARVDGNTTLDLIASATDVLPGAGDGSFGQDIASPDVRSGQLLAAGDWTSDGKVDIAVVNGNWLAVHPGNGDGTFGSVDQAATGIEPTSLVLGDFDQDGVLDVATSSHDSRTADPSGDLVSILRGSGDGTFPSHVDYQVQGPPNDLATGDVNGDGLLDLLVLQNYATLGVMLGTGNGAFSGPVSYAAGGDANALALGDVNDDGRLDVVVASSYPSGLELLVGNGDGTFGPPVPLWPGQPQDVTLVDVDGDRKLDIVTCNYVDDSIAILFGDGSGNFAAPVGYSTAPDPLSVGGADLDGDHVTDLVVTSRNTVSVRLGIGNRELGERVDYAAGGTYLTVTDFDQDGNQDVVVNDPGITVLIGAGDGTFTCLEEFAPGISLLGARVGDVNRDGRLDLVTATYDGVDVFLNSQR